MKQAFLFLIVLCALIKSDAQVFPAQKFEKELLEKDLSSLKKAILDSHPDPFVFCSQEDFEAMYLACNLALEESMTTADFSLVVANLVGILHDSHTAADYNQLLMMQLAEDGYVVPIALERIELMDEQQSFAIIVKYDWEDKLPKGSELVSINGIGVDKLYERSLEYACIEGDATQAQSAVATAMLPVVAGLMKEYGSKNIVEVIPAGATKPIAISIPGYKSKEYHKRALQRSQEGKNAEVKFELDREEDLAILKIGTFAPSSGRKFRKQIAESVKSAIDAGCGNLVLDIRGNGGGSSAWVEYVYSFIETEGYNTPKNVIGKNSEIAMNRSRFFHTAVGKIFTFLFFRNNEDVQSFRKLAALEYGKMDTVYFHVPAKQNQEQVFSGNCYLLINGLTASAGVDFTNAFKSRGRGKIVGEQCLGPVTGTFGNPAWFTLPNSGLRVSISTIRYNYDNSFIYETSGIEPDYFVDCVPEDIRRDVDTQIEFVKKLISEKK
jgi:C-terminal processing protease CtpA/Prc